MKEDINDAVVYGKLIVLQSMKELSEEGVNLNDIQWDFLLDKNMRDICNSNNLEMMAKMFEGKHDDIKDWRENDR